MPENPSPFPARFPRPDNTGAIPTPAPGFSPYMTDPATPAGGAASREPHRKRFLIGGIGIAAVILLGLGGGAAWAVNAHGDYPYQHVAAGATGYVQLNLAPSMLQRMQANSFLSKLPKAGKIDLKKKLETTDSVAKAIVDSIDPGNNLKDYSWAGNRYAVVAYGSVTSWSADGDAAYVMETKDPTKAVKALNAAFNSGYSEKPEKAELLDGNYIVVGSETGIASATNKTLAHLDTDKTFTNAYKGAGDPLSYWLTTDNQVSTGSLSADWNTLKFTAATTGTPLGISAQAQAENKTLTENNSVANPIINAGIADPEALLGPDSAAGKALLAQLGSIAGSSATDEAKASMKTALTALGDNVSISANDKNGRLLLHGTTEAKMNAALTQIAQEPITVNQLVQSYSESGTKVNVSSDTNGLLFTLGNDTAAHPVKLDKTAPGVFVAQVDIDKLPATLLKKSGNKWGTVTVSVSTTDNGTQTDAKWVLP